MMDPNHPTLSVSRQCQLLAISRSSLYDRPVIDNSADRALMALIDRQFLETPYYGSRKMTAGLCRQGYAVNRKREQRMRCSADAPDGATSDLAETEHQ